MGEILTPGQWDDIRNQLKRKHPELTDDDLPYYEAEEADMFDMIKHRLQIYKERIQKKKSKINP